MIPAAGGHEAWREPMAAEPVAAAAPPEFLPPEAFEDLVGTRVWRADARGAAPPSRGPARTREPARQVQGEIASPRGRIARGTPSQVDVPPEPQPQPRRREPRRSESAMASLHEAAIRAPRARGEVRPPPRVRPIEPSPMERSPMEQSVDVQATIERPPPLDPRLLPPLPAALPALRAPAAAPRSSLQPARGPAPRSSHQLAPAPRSTHQPAPAPAFLAPPPYAMPAPYAPQPRRPSTAAAVEPPRFARFSRPRTREGRVLQLSIAAALIAAGVVIFAGYQIWAAQQPHGETTAALADQHATEDVDPITNIALSAQESQKVFHRTSAGFRDLWRSTVWYHPLTDEVFLPENKTRKFGAARHGDRPRECGRGHCGVDIGFFGLQVHAAQDGLVEVVQRHARDNAGKYVRILHDNGFVSYYIHLHRIRDDLQVGMRVKGGEPIGIVGKTGIKRSRPHLHFQLAYRDGNEQFFIDPEPLLRRSVTADDEGAEPAETPEEHAQHVTRAPSPAL